MKKKIITKMLSSICCMVAAAVLLVPTISEQAWAGDTYHNIPGVACAPFNNTQADFLERNHLRIFNPINSPQEVFVICPLNRTVEDVIANAAPQTGFVNVYFAAGATEDVTCIIREYPWTTQGVPTVIAPDIINQVAVTATLPASLPGFSGPVYNLVTRSTGSFNFYTATCRLAKGTGINSIEFH